MTPEQQEIIRLAIYGLWAHDPWMYGNTCAALINREIQWDAPAIVDTVGNGEHGEYVQCRVIMRDGKEFEINHIDGGWSMGYVCEGKERLTPRAADGKERRR